ncbi:hypothetical protein GCM10022224_017230 [Nonomuraea antimicrobica]|uniref:Lipoprotein n=1 Tax=Nonomuraea antimicrobica TaxID=561173 RepID=A0ABP7BCY0_9ACTN
MGRILVVPSLLVALVAAAACTEASGGGSSASGGGSPSAAGSFQRFAACMREHGQNVPDPDPNSGDVALTPPAGADRRAWETAMRACQQFLPNGGAPDDVDPQELEGLRAYAACMREHGVEVTDPDPVTGKSQFGGRFAGAGKDQILNDPIYKAADAACKDKLRSGGAPSKGGGK